MNFFNSKKKYLLIIPIILLLINAFYNVRVIENVRESLLNEKFIQTINSIDMLAATIEANAVPPRDYTNNIIRSVNFLDNLSSTFAAAYSLNGDVWKLQSERNYTTSFCPFQYDEFTRKIERYVNGQLVLTYTPENMNDRNIHLYFRFMPLYAPEAERFLVVSGVSYYSIATIIPDLLVSGQWVGTVITFIINVVFIFLLVRVSYIYHSCKICKLDKEREGE